MKLTGRGKFIVALIVLLVLFGGPALAGYVYLNSIGVWGESDPGRKVEVEIPEGTSGIEAGGILEEAGVIASGFGFRIALYLNAGDEQIQAGTYELPTGLNAQDAIDALAKGPVVEFVTVTYPEGSWLTEFAARTEEATHISGDRFLDLATSGKVRSNFQPDDVDTLEGLLFPSTYQVVEKDTARSLLKRVVTEFENQVGKLDFAKVEQMGYTPYQAIIIASMVEAEAQLDRERGKIARVMYNRLEVGDRLGIDATVLYALGERKDTLTVSELDVDSPYNTRKFTGLPPTPIGAPGIDSLRAALDPPEGDWYFYVLADCDGRHAFSETASEFARDKAAYQALEC